MSELLVNAEGGLTTAGYAVTIIAGIALFLATVFFASKSSSKKRMSTKQLVFCAAALALAYLTSYIKLFETTSLPLRHLVWQASLQRANMVW